MAEKIIGVLGGMGPEATSDLYYRIIKSTPAQKDQEHVRVIIYSNPKVPDRTSAILGNGPNPVPQMTMAAEALERAGADFIIIPCNTAHYFIDSLRTRVGIPILNMIELTAERSLKDFPDVKKMGLIATDGTVKSRIYHHSFSDLGVDILTPTEMKQQDVMKAIYDHIKKGDLNGGREILLKVAKDLVLGGAQIVICGCTEVSLVLKDEDISVPIIDPLQFLAETAIDVALGKIEF